MEIKAGRNFQVGRLFDENDKSYDIAVILNWPTEADYESAKMLDDFPCPKLIDFYFGDTNERDTEMYIDLFIEKQDKTKKLLQKLYALKALTPDDTEIDEQIEFVKSLIVKLY